MRNNYIDPLKVKDIRDYSPREQTILRITFIRLDLYNSGKNCGPKAIQREMHSLEIDNVPSVPTIGRVLRAQYLTYASTGYYPGDPP